VQDCGERGIPRGHVVTVGVLSKEREPRAGRPGPYRRKRRGRAFAVFAVRALRSDTGLEPFGGANGELAAAIQYSIQSVNCDDPERKDLLTDIGTEELSHREVVGVLARLHLKPMKFKRDDAEADPLIAIAGGGGVALHNSVGNPGRRIT
jgi:hypothetical protein